MIMTALLYVLFLGCLVPIQLCVVFLEWLISKCQLAQFAVHRAFAAGQAGGFTQISPDPEQTAEYSVAEQEGRWGEPRPSPNDR
jgi:hypothetical protein